MRRGGGLAQLGKLAMEPLSGAAGGRHVAVSDEGAGGSGVDAAGAELPGDDHRHRVEGGGGGTTPAPE